MRKVIVHAEAFDGFPEILECRDDSEWTPLHLCAYKGRLDAVQLLLSYRPLIDVNPRSKVIDSSAPCRLILPFRKATCHFTLL